MTDIDKLAKSFKRLKKTARCDYDIVQWFMQHPECLPDVPPMLRPYARVNLNETDTYTWINEDGHLAHKLALSYSAVLPDNLPDEFGKDALRQIVGANADIENNREYQNGISGHMKIALNPKEWPYVVTRAALEVLAEGAGANSYFRLRTCQAWHKACPNLSWDLVESLYATGLTPEDERDFAVWALAYKAPAAGTDKSVPCLPMDLAQ